MVESKTPDQRADIVKKLIAVKDRVGAVGKHETPESGQKFKFRGVDTVVNAISDALITEGVLITPISADIVSSEQVTYGKGTLAFRTVVKVRYEWTTVGAYGDSIVSEVVAEAMDSGDKSTTKAMSVAYRVAILQTLTLPTGDKDPDHDNYDVDQKPQPIDTLVERMKTSGFTPKVLKDIIEAAVGHKITSVDDKQLTPAECAVAFTAIESAIADRILGGGGES